MLSVKGLGNGGAGTQNEASEEKMPVSHLYDYCSSTSLKECKEWVRVGDTAQGQVRHRAGQKQAYVGRKHLKYSSFLGWKDKTAPSRQQGIIPPSQGFERTVGEEN